MGEKRETNDGMGAGSDGGRGNEEEQEKKELELERCPAGPGEAIFRHFILTLPRHPSRAMENSPRLVSKKTTAEAHYKRELCSLLAVTKC